MAKIYIVFTYYGYEDFEILGVYKSKRKAVNVYKKWYLNAESNVKSWNNENAEENEQIRSFELQ
jgi:hypothetical protein